VDFEALEAQAWDDAAREYVENLVYNRDVLVCALASRYLMPCWVYSTLED